MSEMIVRFHHDERGAVISWDEVGKLVRCKDCKFYEPSPAGEEFGWCNYFDSRVANNNYCSYGERKKDETN